MIDLLKQMERRFESNNVVDYFLKQAEKIRHENIHNHKYVYWIKTPNGMRLDDESNHKYGDTRKGYEQWKNENDNLVAGYSGNVYLRTIETRTPNKKLVGYITEEKLSDEPWKNEIKDLSKQCFEVLCSELGVKDKETFEYFIFADIDACRGFETDAELKIKLEAMVDVYDKYNDDEHFRKLVDKIKE